MATDNVRVSDGANKKKNMSNTEHTEQLEDRRSLHAVVSRHCAHIRKPYTLEEICEQVEGGEYNAELMLQHLLRWVSANDQVSQNRGAKGVASE